MQEIKDSGIEWVRKIPIGWKVARLKDVIQMLTDYTANGSFGDLAKMCSIWIMRIMQG